MEVPEHVIERLEQRIQGDANGCWLWTGGLTTSGYGRITWSLGGGKITYQMTHRVMYELRVGPIPEGLDIDHLCRVRACCNPDHLEPVTRQTNLLRGDTIPARRAAVTHCPKGHEYTPENTIVDRDRRCCRECTYERNRAYYWKNRERRMAYNREQRVKRKARSASE